LCEIGPDSAPMNEYDISGNVQDGHRFLIYDKSNIAFYDYHYLKI